VKKGALQTALFTSNFKSFNKIKAVVRHEGDYLLGMCLAIHQNVIIVAE
jgi:hypothetical protein